MIPKFVAVLAWLNFYGLTWMMLLNPYLKENSFQAVVLCVLFFIMAVASTSISTKKDESKKEEPKE